MKATAQTFTTTSDSANTDTKYVKISGNTGTWLTNEQYNSLSDSDKSKYKEVDDSGITNVIYNIKDSGDVILAHGTANGSASWSANIDFADDSGNPRFL